ncbi:MAG: hypothetical protein IKH90_06620 [Ruminococcus sp.]|nr:hypothetical protein [Ruminococcus sp.]
MKNCISIKRIKTIMLCAVMGFSAAAQSNAICDIKAFADEDHLINKDSTLNLSSEAINKNFGEVTYWLWKTLTKENFPKDDQYHPMLVFTDSNNTLINPKGAGDIYMLTGAPEDIPGAKTFSSLGENKPQLTSATRDDYGVVLKGSYTAENEQLKPDNKAFFTSGNTPLYPLYVKYNGYDSCDKYKIALSDANNKRANLYLGMVSKHFDYEEYIDFGGYSIESGGPSVKKQQYGMEKGAMVVSQEEKYGSITFEPRQSKNGLPMWIIEDKHGSGTEFATLVGKSSWICAERSTGLGDKVPPEKRDSLEFENKACRIFLGEFNRFSAIPDGTKIESGRMLSIGKGDYITAEGSETSRNGVILPEGRTLTVEKGGVLCISGNFINNGTIRNEGGTIIIQNEGSISPYLCTGSTAKKGCGAIECVDGDIIIQKGGALYAGMNDENGAIVPFYLDDRSTLINQGLLVYGAMRMGQGSRQELFEGSKTYGGYFMGDLTQIDADNNTYMVDTSGYSGEEMMSKFTGNFMSGKEIEKSGLKCAANYSELIGKDDGKKVGLKLHAYRTDENINPQMIVYGDAYYNAKDLIGEEKYRNYRYTFYKQGVL